MTQIVSSISGIEIYAPSAGNAPTNSSEVSAIASAYQVVSSTATQLYAGTSFLTSVNSTPVSASRAGNAANASLANSAWYDGTGRLISALPDRAAVSSIASGYVIGVSATVANNSASWGQGGVSSATVSSIASSYASSAVSGVESAVSANSATWGQGGPVTSTASAAASAYTSTSTSVSSFTGVSSVNGSALLARTLLPDAQQASGNAHFHFMPTATPWGSTEYTGVLSPLQYATGAALAMKQTKTYGAYYKGNEWFISDVGSSYTAANGVVRAELHRTRGIHLYGSSLNSATGFHLNGSGVDGKSGESAWQYGPTEYNMLTAVNDTVSANSASWALTGGDVYTSGFGYNDTAVSSIEGSSLYDNSAHARITTVAGRVNTVSAAVSSLSAAYNETVLWENSAGVQLDSAVSATLSEPTTSFDRVMWYHGTNDGGWSVVNTYPGSAIRCELVRDSYDGATYVIRDGQVMSSPDNVTFRTTRGIRRLQFNSNGSFSLSTSQNTVFKLFKVVGVNRTAGA